jgi:hypothetical protein
MDLTSSIVPMRDAEGFKVIDRRSGGPALVETHQNMRTGFLVQSGRSCHKVRRFDAVRGVSELDDDVIMAVVMCQHVVRGVYSTRTVASIS